MSAGCTGERYLRHGDEQPNDVWDGRLRTTIVYQRACGVILAKMLK